MQPYQEAAQAIKSQGETPLRVGKNAAALAGTAASLYYGGGAVSRVLPFLSKYIPEDLAIKGLSKVDPRYGTFIDKALGAGKTFDEVKEFIGSKIEEAEPAKQKGNIIEMESPELHSFVLDQIKKGISPIAAASAASSNEKFKKAIDNLQKQHKTGWSKIVQDLFGAGEKALPQQGSLKELLASGQVQMPQPGNGYPGAQPQSNAALQQPPQQTQQTQQMPQQGGGDQAKQQLLQAMQALSQKLRS